MNISTPTAPPTLSAEELLRAIRSKGGRCYRMRQAPSVFTLTSDERLAGWLISKGARTNPSAKNGYRRNEAETEWDIWVDSIPVTGEQTIWEACAHGG